MSEQGSRPPAAQQPRSRAHDQGRELLEEARRAQDKLQDTLRIHPPTSTAVINAAAAVRELHRTLIVQHYEYAVRKKVERNLWLLVFHQRIEMFRTKIRKNYMSLTQATAAKDPEAQQAAMDSTRRATAGLSQVLAEGMQFYKALVMDLQKQHGVDCRLTSLVAFLEPKLTSSRSKRPRKLSDTLQLSGTEVALQFVSAASFLDGEKRSARALLVESVKGSCASILLYLGDLCRYRTLLEAEQYGSDALADLDWSAADTLYWQAARLVPQSGNPHNQLAVVANYARDHLRAMCSYLRALLAPTPFPTSEQNLMKLCRLFTTAPLPPRLTPPSAAGAFNGSTGDPATRTEEIEQFVEIHLHLLARIVARERVDEADQLLDDWSLRLLKLADLQSPTVRLPEEVVLLGIAAVEWCRQAKGEADSEAESSAAAARRIAINLVVMLVGSLRIEWLHALRRDYDARDFAELQHAMMPLVMWVAYNHEFLSALDSGAREIVGTDMALIGTTLPQSQRAGRSSPPVTESLTRLLSFGPLRPALTALVGSAGRAGQLVGVATDDVEGLVEAQGSAILFALLHMARAGPNSLIRCGDEPTTVFTPGHKPSSAFEPIDSHCVTPVGVAPSLNLLPVSQPPLAGTSGTATDPLDLASTIGAALPPGPPVAEGFDWDAAAAASAIADLQAHPSAPPFAPLLTPQGFADSVAGAAGAASLPAATRADSARSALAGEETASWPRPPPVAPPPPPAVWQLPVPHSLRVRRPHPDATTLLRDRFTDNTEGVCGDGLGHGTSTQIATGFGLPPGPHGPVADRPDELGTATVDPLLTGGLITPSQLSAGALAVNESFAADLSANPDPNTEPEFPLPPAPRLLPTPGCAAPIWSSNNDPGDAARFLPLGGTAPPSAEPPVSLPAFFDGEKIAGAEEPLEPEGPTQEELLLPGVDVLAPKTEQESLAPGSDRRGAPSPEQLLRAVASLNAMSAEQLQQGLQADTLPITAPPGAPPPLCAPGCGGLWTAPALEAGEYARDGAVSWPSQAAESGVRAAGHGDDSDGRPRRHPP